MRFASDFDSTDKHEFAVLSAIETAAAALLFLMLLAESTASPVIFGAALLTPLLLLRTAYSDEIALSLFEKLAWTLKPSRAFDVLLGLALYGGILWLLVDGLLWLSAYESVYGDSIIFSIHDGAEELTENGSPFVPDFLPFVYWFNFAAGIARNLVTRVLAASVIGGAAFAAITALGLTTIRSISGS